MYYYYLDKYITCTVTNQFIYSVVKCFTLLCQQIFSVSNNYVTFHLIGFICFLYVPFLYSLRHPTSAMLLHIINSTYFSTDLHSLFVVNFFSVNFFFLLCCITLFRSLFSTKSDRFCCKIRIIQIVELKLLLRNIK